MSLDEWLFEKFWYKWQISHQQSEKPIPPNAFELKNVVRRLEIMVLAMTGQHFRILLDSQHAFVSQDHLVLPEYVDHFEDPGKNQNLVFHLVVFLGWASKQGYHLGVSSNNLTLDSWIKKSAELREPLINRFYQEFSCFSELRVESTSYPNKFFGLAAPTIDPIISKQNSVPQTKSQSLKKELAELFVKTKKKAQQKKIDNDKENPLVHIFEKLLSLDSFQGGDKKLDGSDESSEHQKALSEVKLEYVIRTDETAETITNSDSAIEAFEQDDPQDSREIIDAKLFKYDEWDYKLQIFRKNWCNLFEHGKISGELNPNPPLIQDNKNSSWIKNCQDQIDWIFNSRRWVRRQLVGDEIDMNQIVDHVAGSKAGGPGLSRVYCDLHKQDLNLGVLILIDSSQSTDSVIGNLRWIDHVAQALKYISEIFDQRIEVCELASFYSETRKSCHYQILKASEENWLEIDKKLASLRSSGYTRIGTALRHAKSRCLEMTTQKRQIFLITDSKPSDYDRYEGHYGIRDVHHAVEEIRATGIKFTALSSLTQRCESMHEMFGTNGFKYFTDCEDLVNVLIKDLVERP